MSAFDYLAHMAAMVGREVAIVYRRKQRRWDVCFADSPENSLWFGPVRYGGTKAEAIADAERYAYKNDGRYVGSVKDPA